MIGAMHLRPPYALMEWAGITFTGDVVTRKATVSRVTDMTMHVSYTHR